MASDAITGVDARDHQRQNVGTIDRLILDRQTGDVEHVIVATGGFLRIGRDYVQPCLLRERPQLLITMQQDVIDRAPRAWIGDGAEEGERR